MDLPIEDSDSQGVELSGSLNDLKEIDGSMYMFEYIYPQLVGQHTDRIHSGFNAYNASRIMMRRLQLFSNKKSACRCDLLSIKSWVELRCNRG